MTKRRNAPRVEVVDLDDDELGPAETSVEDEILKLIADDPSGDVWRIQVYRVATKPGERDAWLFDIAANELEDIHARLRDECRGGSFRAVIRRNGAIFRKVPYQIEALAPIAAAAAPASSSEGARILEALDRQTKTIADLLGRTMPAPVDPQVQFERTLGLVKTLLEAKGAAVPAEAAPRADAESYMSTFMKGVEFAEKLGNRGAETGLLDIVRDTLPEVVKQLGQMQQRPAPPAPAIASTRPAPSSSPAPRPQTNGAGENGAGADPRTLAALRGHLQYLVGRAAAHAANPQAATPELYAAWVDDNIPGDLLDTLLAAADPVGQLATIEPACANYRDWFDKLIDELAGDDGGEPGTGPDATTPNAGGESA